MNKKKSHIAVIVEGENYEPGIWSNIQSLFPLSEINTICLPAGKNIYYIWKKLKDDNFRTDVIEIVREISPDATKSLSESGLTRDNFSCVYLFFDLDPQQNNLPEDQNPLEVVREMLETFNVATENGKLYISYPMAEALRDIHQNACGAFWKCVMSIDSLRKRKYKTLTSDHNSMTGKHDYELSTWKMLISIFLHRCACLFGENPPGTTKELLRWYKEGEISPAELFDAESRLLNKKGLVFVLSAFPEFLLDYFREDRWKDLPEISHVLHSGDSCAGLASILP